MHGEASRAQAVGFPKVQPAELLGGQYHWGAEFSVGVLKFSHGLSN